MSYCDEDFMIQLQGPHLDKAEEVTDPIFLNMAAAHLKLGDNAMAAHNATQVSETHTYTHTRAGLSQCLNDTCLYVCGGGEWQ